MLKILLLCLSLFWLGCAPTSSPRHSPPERILSLSAAATYILLQLENPPAAIDEFGRLAAGEATLPVIGKGSAISQEKITELRIDCAILWYYQADAARDFQTRGLQVEIIPPLRLENYPALLQQLGQLTGRTAVAEQLQTAFREQLQQVTAATATSPTPVCFELYTHGKIAGEQSYLGDLLRAAGGRSIQAGKSGLLSTERIIEQAPEVIFFVEGFGEVEELSTRTAFANTPAGQQIRIYGVPRQLIIEGIAPVEAITYLKNKISNQ